MREFGSEHPSIVLPDGYFDSLGDIGREITYLRSGREALMAVGLDCKKGEKPVLLMPAYCCWSMSAPFEKVGWKVVYYRLNTDLTVDMSYMEMLLEEYNPSAVLKNICKTLDKKNIMVYIIRLLSRFRYR